MKETKKVVYSDPINDDFAVNKTKKHQVSDDFKYIHTNIFYRFFSFVIFHIIAKPLFYIILKIKYHIRIYNKKAARRLSNTGYFVYMNHTQNIIDAITNQTFLFHKKGYIIASNDVYSLKGLNTLVSMLGTLPTPNNMIQSKKLYDAIEHYVNKKNKVVVIMPEAHIWPYYNDIRPFLDTSFVFPALLNKPILVTTVVYRQRKIFKNRRPYISMYVSDPIFPNLAVSPKERQKELRDQAYNIMKDNVTKHKSFAYIKYEQKTNAK